MLYKFTTTCLRQISSGFYIYQELLRLFRFDLIHSKNGSLLETRYSCVFNVFFALPGGATAEYQVSNCGRFFGVSATPYMVMLNKC